MTRGKGIVGIGAFVDEYLAAALLQRMPQGASLAYGGDWQERSDNFTYDLLRLVSAEQDEAAEREELGDAAGVLRIGRLYNYSAWPHYLRVTPAIEARWINSCRIVRVDQERAGIAPDERIPDGDFDPGRDVARTPRDVPLNSAICLSAMRRLATDGLSLASPDVPRTEFIPPVAARIVLGGKSSGYSGFMPGIYEEALLGLERSIPLYLLGGFGGAAEAVANALLAPPGIPLPEELDPDWQGRHTPNLARLKNLQGSRPLPFGILDTDTGLARLKIAIDKARPDLPGALRTGLDIAETTELMRTRDMRRAAALVHKGLINNKQFVVLAA